MTKKVGKKKLMSESQFQKEILKAFKDDPNIKIFRRNIGGTKKENGSYVRYGQTGQSDLYGWIVEHRCPFCNRLQEGTHFEIELKSADGKLTDKQKEWLEMAARNNAIALLLRPIESDPMRLRERIVRLLERELCPTCCKQSKM